MNATAITDAGVSEIRELSELTDLELFEMWSSQTRFGTVKKLEHFDLISTVGQRGSVA